MFKQIFVMIFFTIGSYLTMDYILKKSLRRFYFINGIVKYTLNCKIKNAVYSNFSEIKDLDNFIFYTTEKVNCNNYIYDFQNDYYYLNDYELVGRQIIDSRGFPTIEVACLDKSTNKYIINIDR